MTRQNINEARRRLHQYIDAMYTRCKVVHVRLNLMVERAHARTPSDYLKQQEFCLIKADFISVYMWNNYHDYRTIAHGLLIET